MKKTKRSLFTSIVTLLLCSAMFVGSTFAWFTDTVSNTGNRIQAGTLKVDLLMYKKNATDDYSYQSIAGGKGDIFKEETVAQNSLETLWEPGKTQFVKLAVENKGNLAIKYNILIDVTDEGLVGSLEYAILPSGHVPPTTEPAALGNWAAVKTQPGVITGDVVAGRTPAASGGVLDEIAYDSTKTNERDYFILAVHMKEDAGNEYQGKDAIIDVTVVATQATAEEDGFGDNDYDDEASFDTIPAPVHEKAEKTIPDNPGSADITFDTKEGSKVESATIQGDAASAILAAAKTGTGDSDNVKVDLSINIDTTEKTSNSITFDITLDKLVKVNGVVDNDKSGAVTDLGDKVASVTLNVGTGLSNVKVNRNHEGISTVLDKLPTADTKADGFFYDGSTGKLTITSSKYSDFICEYDICNHEHVAEWVCDSKSHSGTCLDCGAVIKAEHKYDEGICVCGYKSDVKLLEENPNFTCRIGNTGYLRPFGENINGKKDSALKYAEDGDTITMIKNFETSNSFFAEDYYNDRHRLTVITIDLNGKSIKYGSQIQLMDGTYNIIDSSASKLGEVCNAISLHDNDAPNLIVLNVYGGSIRKISTSSGAASKTINIYDGRVNLIEVQGSNGIDTVNVNGGDIQYVSHANDVIKTVFTFNNGCCIGDEVEYSIKLAEYGSDFMANARKMYSVIVNE